MLAALHPCRTSVPGSDSLASDLEGPPDAHRHLPLHTGQLELPMSFFGFLLRDPVLAGSEPLPSESLWTHLVGSRLFLEFLPLLKTACPLSVRLRERKDGPAFPQGPGAPGGRGSLLASSVPPLRPLGPPEEQVAGTYTQHHVCNEQEDRCSLDCMKPSCFGPSPEEGAVGHRDGQSRF